MGVSYSFDLTIIVMRLEGNYATGDLKAGILAALDDPKCPPSPVLMFDLRESRSLERRSTHDVRDMARFLAAHAARFGHRLAMVAATDLAYGLMRVGAVEAELGGVTPAVFRDVAEARAWLLGMGAGRRSGGWSTTH